MASGVYLCTKPNINVCVCGGPCFPTGKIAYTGFMMREMKYPPEYLNNKRYVQVGRTSLSKIMASSAVWLYGGDKSVINRFDNMHAEKARGMTLDFHFAEYETPRKHITHIDVPGAAEYMKNEMLGLSMADVIVIINRGGTSISDQLPRLMQIASFGPKNIILYNCGKVIRPDLDADFVASVTKAKSIKVINGKDPVELWSNLEFYDQGINELLNTIDNLDVPQRDTYGAFKMSIVKIYRKREDVNLIAGYIESGTVKVGQRVKITGGYNEQYDTYATVASIEIFGKVTAQASAGQLVSMVLEGESGHIYWLRRNYTVCSAEQPANPSKIFLAEITAMPSDYLCGRKNVHMEGYSPMLQVGRQQTPCWLRWDGDTGNYWIRSYSRATGLDEGQKIIIIKTLSRIDAKAGDGIVLYDSDMTVATGHIIKIFR